MKNNLTLVTLIPILSANLEETSKPLFSKKYRNDWTIFILLYFDAI